MTRNENEMKRGQKENEIGSVVQNGIVLSSFFPSRANGSAAFELQNYYQGKWWPNTLKIRSSQNIILTHKKINNFK